MVRRNTVTLIDFGVPNVMSWTRSLSVEIRAGFENDRRGGSDFWNDLKK
tara:strand:- start:2281 stop:2427 length:147 start_codon:yes stop_codon:yes gene_type:complete